MSGIVRANNAGQSGIASNAETIDSDDYVDGSIDTAHIANDQVTGAKLNPSLVLGDIIYADGTDSITRLAKGAAATVLTMGGSNAPTWAAAAGGALDSALTSFVSDGDYRSVYMLGAWPQNGNPGDNDIRGYGGQFKADINGAGSVISQSSDGGGWLFTSGNADQRSCGLFAGDAILQASDDFTITCRFTKTAGSLFSFGMAADVQGYRPDAQNDSIALYFGSGDEVSSTTDNAGTETSTTIAPNSVDGEIYATIIVSGNGTSVAFWINGVLGATHTANIPSVTDLYLFMTVSSYTAAYRTCNVLDFFAYREV